MPGSRPSSGVTLRRGHAVLLVCCWVLALLGGLAQSWNHRFRMNPGGLSYFEIGEAFWRFDLANAVNGFWQPLYPIVLGLVDATIDPSAAWEFQLVHLSNFLIYVLALLACNLFLFALIDRDHRRVSGRHRATGMPIWAWLAAGHGLFLWTVYYFTPVHQVTNDLLSLALLMTVAALYVRLERRHAGRAGSLLLGCLIGLCYLSKLAVLWPALLLLASLATVNRRLESPSRILASGLLGCVLVAAPFVCALSTQKGRLTLGDKGRIAYAWLVNDVEWIAHWQGEPAGSGTPGHERSSNAGRCCWSWADWRRWRSSVASSVEPRGAASRPTRPNGHWRCSPWRAS